MWRSPRLSARRRGQDDPEKANRVLVQSILITLGLTAIISAAAFVFAEPILRLAGSAPDTHEDAVAYFRIITAGMVFNTLTMVINAAQRGAGNTRIAMKTNIVANLVNICFNYLLIGGNLGFPKLGVSGAAIATVLGTVVACVMSFRSVLRHGSFVSLRGRLRISFDRETMRAILNIGSSTLAEQLFLRIGFLTYSIVVANLGTVAFAAHQVGMNVMSISFSFGDGLSVAAVALVGRSLGEKRKDLARIYGGVCQRVGVFFSLLLSIIFLTLGRPIFLLFSTETEVLGYGDMIMRVLVVVVFLQDLAGGVHRLPARRRGRALHGACLARERGVHPAVQRLAAVLPAGAGASGRLARPGDRPVHAFSHDIHPFPQGEMGKPENLTAFGPQKRRNRLPCACWTCFERNLSCSISTPPTRRKC